MVENAVAMESVMKRELSQLDPSVVHTLRGRGLFFAIVINSNPGHCEMKDERGERIDWLILFQKFQRPQHGMFV